MIYCRRNASSSFLAKTEGEGVHPTIGIGSFPLQQGLNGAQMRLILLREFDDDK